VNCNTCKCYGDNPISGMCEGCNNGSKHSRKIGPLQDRMNVLLENGGGRGGYKLYSIELQRENDQLKDLLFTLLNVDEKQLIGHECYAKHVLLSIKDRYERFLTKGVKKHER
jgi:hypothetical protein